VKPVQIGGRDPGLEENGWTTRTFLHQIELAPATDVDPATKTGVEPAITM